MERIEILDSLEQGKISTEKAVYMLSKYKKADYNRKIEKPRVRRKGHWFKIHVKDKDTNLRFYIPISLINLGFSIGKLAVGSKYLRDNEGMEVAQNIMKSIDKRDMKNLTREIKACGKTDLVQVMDGDTFVTISIV